MKKQLILVIGIAFANADIYRMPLHKRATGADALVNDGKSLWYGTISVGTPAVTFTVDIDTGSADLFLPGPTCGSSCSGHTIYDPSASSTSQDLGQAFTLSFDNNVVQGEIYSDTISMAGLTAVDQTIGVAAQYGNGFDIAQFPPDGVLGMAFQSISSSNASTFFQSLVSQGQIDEPVFSLKLSSSGSELYLGGANSALYTGDFTYTPVTQQGYWEVNLNGIEGNGQTILSNIDAIIDTGTSLVIGNPSQIAAFYTALGGTDASSTVGPGFYTFPCDSFPSVSMTFGGTSFPISAETLNLGPVSQGSSDCVAGFVGQDTGASFWTIGSVFLQNVYSTFDIGNLQVGFAQLA